jgi:hypothetical protein
LPDDVVDANDVLFLGVFGGADDSGTGLHPGVAAQLIHYPVVVSQDLAFIHYCNQKMSN